MTPKKDLALVSALLVFLSVLDIIGYAVNFFRGDLLAMTSHPLLIAIFVFTLLITLAKGYMGAMGLAYCKDCGKGTFHITLAKIGIVLCVIAVVIAVVDLIGGNGSIPTLISDLMDVFIVWWYFTAAKKVLA